MKLSTYPILVRPIHSVEFLTAHNLGVEAHLGRYDKLDSWPKYVPFVGGVHLPYDGLNLAAFDDDMRRKSIRTLSRVLESASKYPVDRVVMHSVGTEFDEAGQTVGEYGRLVESIQTLASHSATLGLTICVENNLVYYGRPHRRWCDSAEEWITLCLDVARDNVMLTLDTSHCSNSSMRAKSYDGRVAILNSFLARPELIGRVHWSDSIIKSDKGKIDQHLVPGQGDLPLDFHRAIKSLPVTKLLEQNCTEDEVVTGLHFIDQL